MELIINPKDFDQQVFQTNTEFTTEQYNTWLHDTAIKALQRIYEKIDGLVIPHDQYLLGNVINLLSAITIDPEPQAPTWTVTQGDIADKYDISHLSDTEIRTLVDRCANVCQNDGMAEYYHEAIRYVCEDEYNFSERKPIAHYSFVDKETGEEFSGQFKLDYAHEDGEFDDGRKIWSRCFSSSTRFYEVMYTEKDDAPSAYRVIDGENHDEYIDEQEMWIE